MGAANHKAEFARDGELWREADTVTHPTLITWDETIAQPLDGVRRIRGCRTPGCTVPQLRPLGAGRTQVGVRDRDDVVPAREL